MISRRQARASVEREPRALAFAKSTVRASRNSTILDERPRVILDDRRVTNAEAEQESAWVSIVEVVERIRQFAVDRSPRY